MSDFVFNIAKGKIKFYGELSGTNDALIAVLLKSAGLVADSVLIDIDDLATILSGASDEADFTNYARQTLTNVTVTVDDTNDRLDIDCDDISIASAGGASNNTLGKLIICYDPDTTSGTDSTLVPVSAHDITTTTDGSSITYTIPSLGFARAA